MLFPGRESARGSPRRTQAARTKFNGSGDRKERWRGHTPTITDAQDNNKVEGYSSPGKYVNLVACPALALLVRSLEATTRRSHAEARGDLHGRRHLHTLRRRNGTGHPGSAVALPSQSRHLRLRSGRLAPVSAQRVGNFDALLRCCAPDNDQNGRAAAFPCTEVARTPMAWILPVTGIVHFAFDRNSGRV